MLNQSFISGINLSWLFIDISFSIYFWIPFAKIKKKKKTFSVSVRDIDLKFSFLIKPLILLHYLLVHIVVSLMKSVVILIFFP